MERKAHGTAGRTVYIVSAEPGPAGLNQTALTMYTVRPKAVLEQPSSRRVEWQKPG